MTNNEIAIERIKDKTELISRSLNQILERFGEKETDLTVIKDPEYWIQSREDVLKIIGAAVEGLYDIDDIAAAIA